MRLSRINGFSFNANWGRSLVAVSIAGTVALAPASALGQGALPKTVNIATNPAGTLYYGLTSGIAATLAANAPFKAEAAPYSGTSTFMPLLNEGRELDFGMVNAVDMGMAYMGPEKRKIGGKNPFSRSPNVRLVVRGGAMQVGVYVPKNSPIHNLRAVKGHKMSGEYPAHQAVWYNGLGNLSSCGLSWSDVDVVPVPAVNDGMDALKDGRVEVSMHAVGSGKVREVDAAIGVRMLPICDDEEAQKRVAKTVPGYSIMKFKPGSTVGVSEPASAVSYDVYLGTSKSMSDQVVYEVVKALWNGQKTLFTKHPILKRWKKERFASTETTIPYHPGAIKFFKEKGVWTDAMQKHQQELLRESR